MNGVAKENRENGYILESFQPEQEQNIFPPIFDTQRYGRPNNSLLVDSWMYKESDAILKVDANCQSFQPNNALENALAVSVVKNVLPATCFTQQYTNHIPAKIKQRFDCILQARTAVQQQRTGPSLTYLNRGQTYHITINDNYAWNGNIEVSAILTFHDEQHRKKAKKNWAFWVFQQTNPSRAQAVEIDTTKSTGLIGSKQNDKFDRVSAVFNGCSGAKLCLKFNVLSTDFSRTKGIKGISMGLVLEFKLCSQENLVNEYYYCQIKLFRDKGAERKNKDDEKQLNKLIKKLNGRSGGRQNVNKFLSTYSMVSRVTRMVQVDFNYDLDGSFESLLVEEFSGFPNPFNERQCSNLTSTAQNSSGLYLNNLEGDSSKNLTTINKEIVVSRNGKNRKNTIIDGFDPGYVPRKRTKNYELCLYVNFYGSDRYNAIYLEKLTVGCLLEKLRFYLTEDSQQQYIEVFRETTTGLRIFLDDKEVQRMEDEQGMSAELVYFNEQSIKAILLRY